MSEILEKINSRGYWRVGIRPAEFESRLVEDISALFPLVEKNVVRFRGWDFPHIDYREPYHIDIDWVGQEFDWQHKKEIWRFYQSGQFIHISCMSIDWRDESTLWPADEHWAPSQVLGIGETIARFTEIFEFATRLSLSEAGSERMHLEVVLSNLKGRQLYVDSISRWDLHSTYRASLNEFPYQLDTTRQELIATQRNRALLAANEVFKRFGWASTTEVLKSWQEEVTK
jgi:hypothetical protein